MVLDSDNGHRFDVEWETLESALRSELDGQADCYVVVVGGAVFGTFETYNGALEAGYKACGFSPFLLKRLPPRGGSLARRQAVPQPIKRQTYRRSFMRPLKLLVERLHP